MTETASNSRIIHVVTPENIEISYELAGIGSRFAAVAIDHSIQAGIILVVTLAVHLITEVTSKVSIFSNSAPLWAEGLLLVAFFVIFQGYFIFFELRNGGQTPGKKAVGLRVVRDGGYPIDPMASVIRNLVRIVDLLVPPPYGAGVLCIFLNRDYKRLGDLAAGTIVIKERTATPVVARVRPPLSAVALSMLPQITNVHQLRPEEYSVIELYLDKRETLQPGPQVDYAMRIAVPVMNSMGINIAMAQQTHYIDLLMAIRHCYLAEKEHPTSPVQPVPEDQLFENSSSMSL